MRHYWLFAFVVAGFMSFFLVDSAHAHFGHPGHWLPGPPDDDTQWSPTLVAAKDGASPTTVARFASPDLPTGLTINRQGDIYLSMGITGEIRKIARNGRQSVVTTFKTGFFTGFGFLGAVAVDERGDIYAAFVSFNVPDSDTHGIWRIRPNGTRQLIAAFPANSFPHAMAFDRRGDLFVTDAFLGTIWRITPGGQMTPWLQHPLFQPDPAACPPQEAPFPEGLGGIAFDERGDAFVTKLNKALVLRIPITPAGIGGTPTIVAGPDCARLDGIDGLAIDTRGDLYVANENKHTVLRIGSGGTITTLVTPADGTDSPHAIAFGTHGNQKKDLYFANFAGLTYLAGGTPRPSLMKIDVGVHGVPVPP